MMMKLVNRIYTGSNGRQSLIDLEIPENFNGNLIVFVHGFMGFKDWGAWNLVQQFFTERGFGFCKFNLSHNGGTIENGIDFPDEKAFGENRYSYEVQDIESALHWMIQQAKNIQGIHLIGHSRGGGDVILAASKYQSEFPIKTVHTWAGISDIGSRFPNEEELKKWKQEGIRYVMNGRTKQNLPQYFSLYEDYQRNASELNIEIAIKDLKIPITLYHGDKDTSVPIEEGYDLAKWKGLDLHVIKIADHVFGAVHPWRSTTLPSTLMELCELTLNYLK
jgi:pimeloyl-ACP methyl ester carboxylesterase